MISGEIKIKRKMRKIMVKRKTKSRVTAKRLRPLIPTLTFNLNHPNQVH